MYSAIQPDNVVNYYRYSSLIAVGSPSSKKSHKNPIGVDYSTIKYEMVGITKPRRRLNYLLVEIMEISYQNE